MNKTLSYLLLSVLILDIVNGQFFFRAKLRERKKNKDDFDVQSTATSANRASPGVSRPSISSTNPSSRPSLASRLGAASLARDTLNNLEKPDTVNEKGDKESAKISPFANRYLKRLQSVHTVLQANDEQKPASLTKDQPSKTSNKKSHAHRFGGREKSSSLKTNFLSSLKSSENVPTKTQKASEKLPKTAESPYKSRSFNNNNFNSFNTGSKTSYHRFSSNTFSTNSFGSKSFSVPSFSSSSKATEEVVTSTESIVLKESSPSEADTITTTPTTSTTTLETSTATPTFDTSTVMPTFDYSTEKAAFDVSTIKTTFVTFSSISTTLSTLITAISTPKPLIDFSDNSLADFSSSSFQGSSTRSFSSTSLADLSTTTKFADFSTDFSTTPSTTTFSIEYSSTESIFEAPPKNSEKRLQRKSNDETDKFGSVYRKIW